MESGITALLSLDGSPLDPQDCAALGLACGGGETAAAAAHDAVLGQVDLSHEPTPGGFALLAGRLSDPAGLAARLGMATDTPAALLAHRVRQERGKDMALLLDGEWSYFEWHAEARQAVAALSLTTRDPLYFATDGRKLALSPRMIPLARLPWVDSAYDTLGLCLHLAKAGVRGQLSQQTPFAGITRVAPGHTETFGRVRRSETCAPPELPPRWQGSFEEAVAAFDAELTRLFRRQMHGHGQVALMLSGGLDSSAVAYYAGKAREAEQGLVAITSVAGSQADDPDEAALAAQVAAQLDIPLVQVVPDSSASVYLPSDSLFDRGELPVVSPRHYLYEAIHACAAEQGASLLLDGSYGEGSISYRLPLTPALPPLFGWLRARAGDLLRRRRQRHMQGFAWQFHPYLSAPVLAELARIESVNRERGRPERHRLRPDQQFGYLPAMAKNAMSPTTSPFGAARHTYPFRERSLLRLMASMPAGFIEHGGSDRALVRALLAGRVPDEVVTKPKGGSFSPDFDNRIRDQAGHILNALPTWRRGVAADWLDLDQLEQGAQKLSGGIAIPPPMRFQLQTTSACAAWFHWVERRLTGQPD